MNEPAPLTHAPTPNPTNPDLAPLFKALDDYVDARALAIVQHREPLGVVVPMVLVYKRIEDARTACSLALEAWMSKRTAWLASTNPFPGR